jgi:hypothetical protein
MDASEIRLVGITNTSPAGFTAMSVATKPSRFCQSIVFPSADSFVTKEVVDSLSDQDSKYSAPELSVAIRETLRGSHSL